MKEVEGEARCLGLDNIRTAPGKIRWRRVELRHRRDWGRRSVVQCVHGRRRDLCLFGRGFHCTEKTCFWFSSKVLCREC